MKYLLGIVSAVVVLIVAFVLILNRGGDDAPKPPEPGIISETPEYSDGDATFVFITQGELKAQEDYREIRISVSQSIRKLEVIEGYNNKTIESKSYSNTKAAFDAFVNALGPAGFRVEESNAIQDTEAGMCPLGKRYIYEIRVSGEQKQRLWSSSCRKINGTASANRRLVEELFQNQIPDYRDLTRGTRL